MKKALFFLPLLMFWCCSVKAQDKVTVSQNGLETTMSNGIISLIIGTNGRINTLPYGNSENLMTLTYDGKDGSGVMWDCLKLEVGGVVTSGIETAMDADVTTPIEYYDLRGRRIATPQYSGIYIWRQGNKSGKMIKR